MCKPRLATLTRRGLPLWNPLPILDCMSVGPAPQELGEQLYGPVASHVQFRPSEMANRATPERLARLAMSLAGSAHAIVCQALRVESEMANPSVCWQSRSAACQRGEGDQPPKSRVAPCSSHP